MMNNWYVITGAPYAGKTTLVNQLEEKGYLVAHETARTYIDNEIKKGRSIEEMRKDDALFQREILRMKVELESSLPKDEIIFLDRGIPDSEVAWYCLQCGRDHVGINPPEICPSCDHPKGYFQIKCEQF